MIEEKVKEWTGNSKNENTNDKEITRQIEQVILGNRQIRTKSTIFLFHIFELRGALSSDVMYTLKRFKPILDYGAMKWKLPKLVRIIVSDTIWPGTAYLGARFMSDSQRKPYFDIHINLENLHEAEQQFNETKDFMIQGILMLFLHECAHLSQNMREKQSRWLRN